MQEYATPCGFLHSLLEMVKVQSREVRGQGVLGASVVLKALCRHEAPAVASPEMLAACVVQCVTFKE